MRRQVILKRTETPLGWICPYRSPADNISHRTIVVDKNGPATDDSRTDVDRFIGPDPKQI